MSMSNVTCHYHLQKLNHFDPSNSHTFSQRYCIYSAYDNNNNNTLTNNNPIFFYTGNESPIDEYVNNTGLMWELAPKHSALLVFAEHRYEGHSLPDFATSGNGNCLAHATSKQALADYATLLSYLNPNFTRPVIVFGGSYGGMLSAYMRMIYSGSVAGSIASSAPIWGLPLTNHGIDGAYRVVARALRLPYPPTATTRNEKNYCFENLLASWPLLLYYSQTFYGRSVLSNQFNLCTPLSSTKDGWTLLEWAQSPWFNLAEGDYPFETSYIPYALQKLLSKLPPWPLQRACSDGGLNTDLGIRFENEDGIKNVKYKITYGESGIELNIDWDKLTWDTTTNGVDEEKVFMKQNKIIEKMKLFRRLKDAVAVWFNVTGDLDCFEVVNTNDDEEEKEKEIIVANDNVISDYTTKVETERERQQLGQNNQFFKHNNNNSTTTPEQQCQTKTKKEGCWTSLCCNEDMNLIITQARGLGNDFFWPPSHPRGTKTYSDIVSQSSHDKKKHDGNEYCADDPNEIFGYPKSYDPWSKWLDNYYGGLRIESHSNIIFSNGLLDPWSAAGVYAPGEMNPTALVNETYDGPMVQNITQDGSIIALILDLGGHHLDLMYSTEEDPECVVEARKIENEYIGRWIEEWRDNVRRRRRRTCFSNSCVQ